MEKRYVHLVQIRDKFYLFITTMTRETLKYEWGARRALSQDLDEDAVAAFVEHARRWNDKEFKSEEVRGHFIGAWLKEHTQPVTLAWFRKEGPCRQG